MESNLISVIVPVYKVENYIDECVKSIVSQTYNNLEIILVDDGSPDNCPSICDSWARKDKRVKVFHKKNGGLSSARNYGLNNATGDLVCFVDSDDFLSLDAIEQMYQNIYSNSDIGIVSGMIYRYENGNQNAFKQNWILTEPRVVASDELAKRIVDESVSYTVWNKLYRKDILENIRFKEGRNNEDTLFMYSLSKVMKVKKLSMLEIPDYVYYYRWRENSITTSSKTPLAIDAIQNLEEMMNDCKDNDKLLFETIYFQYTRRLFFFLESMLINKIWESSYFKQYQGKIRKIPLKYLFHHYKFNDVIYIELLKWLPSLRKAIKIFKSRINR